MIRKLDTPGGQLTFGALLAAGVLAAFVVAGHLGTGLVAGAIVLAYTMIVVLGRRRSPTLEALSGIGDERTTSISMRACALSGSLLAAVIVVWWLVSIARGHENTTLTTLGAVFGLCFMVSCSVLQRRS